MGRQDLVVHAFTRDDASSVFSVGEPRFGLIVSKAVGPAVTRHRVARRLRHVCAQFLLDVPQTSDVVIRALPGASSLSSRELHRQVRSGLKKLGYLHRVDPGAVASDAVASGSADSGVVASSGTGSGDSNP